MGKIWNFLGVGVNVTFITVKYGYWILRKRVRPYCSQMDRIQERASLRGELGNRIRFFGFKTTLVDDKHISLKNPFQFPLEVENVTQPWNIQEIWLVNKILQHLIWQIEYQMRFNVVI